VSKLRDDHLALNYFTADQLVVLSTQLALHASNNKPLSPQSIMLLNLIAPNLNRKQLSVFVKATLSKNQTEEELMPPSEEVESEMEEDGDEDSDSDAVQKDPLHELRLSEAYQELAKDFSQDLVLAALILLGCQDVDKAMEWCFEHSEENVEEILQEFYRQNRLEKTKFEASPSITGKSNPEDFDLLFGTERDGLLSNQLKSVWQQFLGRVNSLEITDHLSFQALANCIDKLYAKHGTHPGRKFIPTFIEGSPNLVLCPDDEMHFVALSLYMMDPSKALPCLDEVLICHTDTPKEQIELFCRRSFSDTSGKIYIILHAESMNYDTGLFIENLVKTTTVSNEKYRLIFLVSKENNNHSYLVTAFDKFRRQMAAIPSHDKIKNYLLSQLQTELSVDPDKSRIRIVKSGQSGNGKSLVAQRLSERNPTGKRKILQLHESSVDFSLIISTWLEERGRSNIFHLDVTPTVLSKKADLTFSLTVLGGLADSSGQIWLNGKQEYYIIELTSDLTKNKSGKNVKLEFEEVIPSIFCPNPTQTAELLASNPDLQSEFLRGERSGDWTYLFDYEKFTSEVFQRPYLYLNLMKDSTKEGILDYCSYSQPTDLSFLLDCLDTLLESCPVENPAWTELTNFASFLNAKLSSSEHSIFCNSDLMREDFPGMKTFVIKSLVQMSRDFSTRSVKISDQSQCDEITNLDIEKRRKWENSPHPYIFFNDDGHTMTFFGFHLDANLNLIDESSGQILEHRIMTRPLYEGLRRNSVVFDQAFDFKTEAQKIAILSRVLGVKTLQNPDKSYELTSDNVMKILAIHTRFQCNIPVVIMGETGCGKTRLIKFLCDILCDGKNVQNLLIMKTHGGITEENIFDIVRKAITQAEANLRQGVKHTVLFFDEANTTNAIGAIKAVMCDHLVNGVPIPNNIGLHFVAAVNPYREHSKEMINKLENAGLGYHIKYDKTPDKLRKIPMRRLVYRVKEIPASMFPLIWDFGNLDASTEKKYISQMISNLQLDQIFKNQLLEVLCQSQQFMRERKDECSFVSLRDVERMLKILQWFQEQEQIIMPQIFQKLLPNTAQDPRIRFTVNLILALGVAYYTRLDERRGDYEEEMTNCLGLDAQFFSQVIVTCQEIFIDELRLEQNIAKNDALKENIWMMAICIELRIPLFLVGKPGSSKSLAKTVITDVMQGEASYSKELFRHLKEIHMVSFQCSPLATAGGILSTFRQCQKFQEKRDLNQFAAVCVLDEIGLAEDSPKMPLKTLHPLLEDGCVDFDTPEPHKKVSAHLVFNYLTHIFVKYNFVTNPA